MLILTTSSSNVLILLQYNYRRMTSVIPSSTMRRSRHGVCIIMCHRRRHRRHYVHVSPTLNNKTCHHHHRHVYVTSTLNNKTWQTLKVLKWWVLGGSTHIIISSSITRPFTRRTTGRVRGRVEEESCRRVVSQLCQVEKAPAVLVTSIVGSTLCVRQRISWLPKEVIFEGFL